MKKILPLTIFSIFFYCQSTLAQLSEKDFRLCISNLGCSDSTLRVKKQDLLKANKITANFPWLTIKSLVVYIGEGNYTSEIITRTVSGNELNDNVRDVFQRLSPGNLVTILVEGYNTKGQRVPWATLSIRIIE